MSIKSIENPGVSPAQPPEKIRDKPKERREPSPKTEKLEKEKPEEPGKGDSIDVDA